MTLQDFEIKNIILRSPRSLRKTHQTEIPPPTAGASTVIRAGLTRPLEKSPAIAFNELKIETTTTTLAEQREREKDDTIFLEFPDMPVSLIKPVTLSHAADSNGGDTNGDSWGISAIGASEAGPEAGAEVVVAVLDTGIDMEHPAFKDNNLNIVPKNFTSDIEKDIDGHGTHCAGTIFGRDVEGQRIGIARGVRKALIGKVIGNSGGSMESIYRSMQWAISEGAHVISMSLGIDFVGYRENLVQKYGIQPRQATSLALAGYRANIRLFDIISKMVTLPDDLIGGTVVTAAAGNESNRPQYAITVSPPAAGEQFLSVAAIDKSFNVASFSNEDAAIAAPGVNILSAMPKGGLTLKSGTSMAAPHVAGAAVLWAERMMANQSFNANKVIQLIFRNTKPLPGLATREVGEGLVQAPKK